MSLGTGAFMATGGYMGFKLATADFGIEGFELHILFIVFASGIITAVVGVIFGLPSLRIKGSLFSSSNFGGTILLTVVVHSRSLVRQ